MTMTTQVTVSRQKDEAPARMYPASPFRLFEDFFNNWAFQTAQNRFADTWKPAVDIYEKDGNMILRTEIPGLSEKDVELKVEGKVLTIKGERKQENESEGVVFQQVEGFYGSFSRSFALPETADVDKISASFRNGILTITIPQKPESRPRNIKINY